MDNQKGLRRGRGWARPLCCLLALTPVAVPAFSQEPVVMTPVYIIGWRHDASGASFKNVVLTPSDCLFDYVQLGDRVQRYHYPCQLVSATARIARETPRGSFSIRFDLPGGPLTQNFIIARRGDIRLDGSQPGALAPFDFGDQFRFSSAPPYGLGDIQVTPLPPRPPAPPAPPSTSHDVYKLVQGANGAVAYEYAGTAAGPEAANLPPPPAIKRLILPLHLHIDGFECSMRLEGRPAAPCVVNAWSRDFIGLEVGGDAIGLSKTPISFMVTRNGKGRWVYIPFAPSTDADRAGGGSKLTAVSSAMTPAVDTYYVATHVFAGHTTSETVEVVLSGKECTYHETFAPSDFDRHQAVYPCEVAAERPSLHPSFTQDHDYGVVVSLPQGKRYLQFLAMPNGPGLEGPPGVPPLETSITSFEPYPLPPRAELDIPGDPPLHLSVSGLDCSTSAAGHGSFPCRLGLSGAESLSIDIDGLYFDPSAESQNWGFSLNRLITGWTMPEDPQRVFRFGPVHPEAPIPPRPHYPHPAPEPGKIEKTIGRVLLAPIAGVSGHSNPHPAPKPPSEPGVHDVTKLGFQSGPMPGSVSYFGLDGAAFEGESVHITNLSNGEYRDTDVEYGGRFWVDVPGAMDDLYAISFDVPGKDGLRVYQRGDDPPLGLLGPGSPNRSAGSETEGNDLMSMGNYAGPADVGVVVGGQVATLDHGVFLANDVGLKPGENTIPVTITALGGWKLTKNFTIKSTGKWPLRLVSDAYAGKPLEMRFGYSGEVALPLRNLTIASNWGDAPRLTADNPTADATLTHAYAAHGLHPVQLTVTDAQGASYSVERPVLIPDPSETDAAATYAWQYFLKALAARDRAAVMSALTAGGQKRLSDTVDIFMRQRDKRLDGSLPLVRETSTGGVLTYGVGQPGATLHVGFKQDTDGVWRIDSMD